MADIVFVTIVLAFFGISYLYVLGCDRIIGREAPSSGAGDAGSGPAAADDIDAVVRS